MSVEIWHPRPQVMERAMLYGLRSGPDRAEIAAMLLGEAYERVLVVDVEDLDDAYIEVETREQGPTRSTAVGDVFARVDGHERTWYVVAHIGFDELDVHGAAGGAS